MKLDPRLVPLALRVADALKKRKKLFTNPDDRRRLQDELVEVCQKGVHSAFFQASVDKKMGAKSDDELPVLRYAKTFDFTADTEFYKAVSTAVQRREEQEHGQEQHRTKHGSQEKEKAQSKTPKKGYTVDSDDNGESRHAFSGRRTDQLCRCQR